jgi:chromosome segregation ATPase
LLEQRDQYKELMMNAMGGDAPTPSKSRPIAALSAVTGGFSAIKKQAVARLKAQNTDQSEEVARLTAQIEGLKDMERLRPQLMELQQTLATVQQEAEDAARQREEDSAALEEESRELAAALQQAQKLAEKNNSAKEAGLALASEWSARAETAEREVRRQNEELDSIKEQMEEMVAQAIDPTVVDQLNAKITELES